MTIGTKSVLFGAHCFVLHPWFVAAAWWRLYGFPWDPRLWIAFFTHDLGYFGKPNMDGPEGESHVLFGARVMSALFDAEIEQEGTVETCPYGFPMDGSPHRLAFQSGGLMSWFSFMQFHSRFWAKKYNQPVSRLGVADKLSIVLTPSWLYLPMARLSGEVYEYMALAKKRTAEGEPKYASMKLTTDSRDRWYADVQEYLRRWVEEHKDGREDTWTPKST